MSEENKNLTIIEERTISICVVLQNLQMRNLVAKLSYPLKSWREISTTEEQQKFHVTLPRTYFGKKASLEMLPKRPQFKYFEGRFRI